MCAKDRDLWTILDCVTYTLHTAQGGVDRGSTASLVVLPQVLFGGGRAGAVTKGVFGGPGGGCDAISIG